MAPALHAQRVLRCRTCTHTCTHTHAYLPVMMPQQGIAGIGRNALAEWEWMESLGRGSSGGGRACRMARDGCFFGIYAIIIAADHRFVN